MHPVLIRFSDTFFLATYGFMIALGLIVAISVAAWRGKRRGFAPDVFFDLAFVGVLSGFVSARLLFILQNFGEFLRHPFSMIFSRSGFVFLGGLIGAVVACIIYVRRKKLPVMVVGDIAAPSIAIAHAFGRIGCHFAGCCWGGVCEKPGLGIRVPSHLIPGTYEPFESAAKYFPGEIIRGVIYSKPVWPVQLMESSALFLLAGVLILFAVKPRRPGQTLALYLAGYAVLRFTLEFFRGDVDRGLYFNNLISTSQLISLAMIPFAVGIWAWSRRRPVVEIRVADNKTPQNHEETAASQSKRRRKRS